MSGNRSWSAPLAGLLLCACAAGGPAEPEAGPAAPAGYTGALVVSPDPAVFEDTRVGCTRTLPLQITSTAGEGEVTIAGVTSASRAFRPAAALPLPVPAGGRGVVDLHFVPSAPGEAAATVAFATGEPGEPLVLDVRATAVEAGPGDGAAAPIDLVVALDVSTTMTGAASARAALAAALARAQDGGLDARFGLVTFVDDVRIHGDGTWLDRDALLAELDAELDPETGRPDPDAPRQLLNFDFQEDVLGALHAAATRFVFRADARRAILLVTDGGFLEPPAAFSGGQPARRSFAEVARALGEGGVRLVAVTDVANGAGLGSTLREEPSLVARTGGSWFELADVRAGAPALETIVIDELEGRGCD